MYEEDWGFFVYLEEDKKYKIPEEVAEPFQNQYKKTLLLNTNLNLDYLPIIYEECEWYINNNPESEYQFKIDIDIDSSVSQKNLDDMEKKKSCLYEKKRILIYYVVCISFISLAFIV
uniref:Uncharacterized protein n=1 Tax=viral metagenome TaxID=1070528 RepID=A0A6C0DBC7_9ZZZZ